MWKWNSLRISQFSGDFLYNFLKKYLFLYSIETKAAFDIFPYRWDKLIRMEIKYIFFYNKYKGNIVFWMILSISYKLFP